MGRTVHQTNFSRVAKNGLGIGTRLVLHVHALSLTRAPHNAAHSSNIIYAIVFLEPRKVFQPIRNMYSAFGMAF